MEDFMSTFDLVDLKPNKGRFTWSNNILGPGHIAAHLDHFLLSGNLLEDPLIPSSHILSWSSFDHRPISLIFTDPKYLGPIPFRFNPLWFQDPSFLGLGLYLLESMDPWIPSGHMGKKAQTSKAGHQAVGFNSG
jgi:hypothetical protein